MMGTCTARVYVYSCFSSLFFLSTSLSISLVKDLCIKGMSVHTLHAFCCCFLPLSFCQLQEPYLFHEFPEDFVGSPITVIITGFLRSEAAFSSFGRLGEIFLFPSLSLFFLSFGRSFSRLSWSERVAFFPRSLGST